MKIRNFLIRSGLILVFLTLAIFLSAWKLVWNDLPQVYPISYPLVSNTELIPGDTLVQEFKTLSQGFIELSIPLKMEQESNLLVSINQIDGPSYSVEIKPITRGKTIMYTINWPNTLWKKNRSVYLTLSVPPNSEKIGIGLHKHFVFDLRKFSGKAEINGIGIPNNLEFLPHYSDINEPILAGRYVNPLELTYLLIYGNIFQDRFLFLLSIGIVGCSVYQLYKIEVSNKYLFVAICLMILLGVFF